MLRSKIESNSGNKIYNFFSYIYKYIFEKNSQNESIYDTKDIIKGIEKI